MKRLLLSFSIVLVLSFGVCAQSAASELKHFAADGVSFDYPDAYTVKDESNSEAQRFILTRRGSSVQLTIVAKKGWVLSNEVPAAIEKSTAPLIQQVAATLGTNPAQRTSIKPMVGSKEAEGVRLRSSANSKRTAEVIWLRLSLRLISMALVRSDQDESSATQLWQAVGSSIKAEPPVLAAAKPDAESTHESTGPHEPITGGVLNGKALALPQPAYPAIARAAHVSGTVIVQVVIDEQGNVVSAKAIDGHPLLQAVSVAAAREAKFSPTTLEGEPVKVTGVIQYNFVAR